MAQSQLNLYNLAVSLAGGDYTIASTGEGSIPAAACELHYENVRQVMFRAAHWNSLRRFARLTQDAERDDDAAWVSTDPSPGWAFSYALPTSCLAARFLADFSEFDLSYDNNSRILNTNLGGTATEDKPILCYTVDSTDPTLWEPDLYQSVYLALAAIICGPLTGKNAKVQTLSAMANSILASARAANANEYFRRFQQTPGNLQARGYNYTVSTPFVYPYGAMFSVTGAPLT